MQDYSVISGETLTIRRTNPRTLIFIYLLVVFVIAFPLMYLFAPGMRNLPWFFFVAIAAAVFFNMRIWGLLTKITIGPDGVRYRSLMNEYLYPWREIKSAGIYTQTKNSKQVLDRKEFNETYHLRLKYVWFSIFEGGTPGVFVLPGKNYCDFEFDEKAWTLFNKYLVGNADPTKLPGFDPLKMGEPQRRGF